MYMYYSFVVRDAYCTYSVLTQSLNELCNSIPALKVCLLSCLPTYVFMALSLVLITLSLVSVSCACHFVTCACHSVTCICHSVTCICHSVPCACHSVTCICHSVTCACHSVTCASYSLYLSQVKRSIIRPFTLRLKALTFLASEIVLLSVKNVQDTLY